MKRTHAQVRAHKYQEDRKEGTHNREPDRLHITIERQLLPYKHMHACTQTRRNAVEETNNNDTQSLTTWEPMDRAHPTTTDSNHVSAAKGTRGHHQSRLCTPHHTVHVIKQ